MNTRPGTGVMLFGVVLVIAGAIMRFAVSAHTSGFNIHEAGVILLLVGVGVFILGLLILSFGGETHRTHRTHMQGDPSYQRLHEEMDKEGVPTMDDLMHMPSSPEPLLMTDWRSPVPDKESEQAQTSLDNKHIDEPRKGEG
jgi:hypothetical protein